MPQTAKLRINKLNSTTVTARATFLRNDPIMVAGDPFLTGRAG
jgi:hypothetical protein